jgi:D-arabinose 1-dehydrogenase-like Zn-dependent alcohol dehydrogenase
MRRVAISGAGGGLGHLGIQFSHALGYKTIAIDARDSSLSLIHSLGCADLVVDARKQSTQEVFEKCNNGLGVDAVLILPESQRAFDYAAPLARKAGTVCVVSFPVEGFKISSQEVVFRDVRIRGIPLNPPTFSLSLSPLLHL